MLEDCHINDHLLYEQHYLKLADSDVAIGGALGAALLCALLVNTEEGVRRKIAIYGDIEQRVWITCYEKEVIRDEWGLLHKEIELLSDAYIGLETEQKTLLDICPNVRLLDLALKLLTGYMHYLNMETFGAHIWECYLWEDPFAQWLLHASRVETRRQRLLHTDWTDPAVVTALAAQPFALEQPTLYFEGEAVEDIMKRYYKWRWSTFQAQLRELPGSQPRAPKHRNYVFEQETEWLYLQDEMQDFNEEQQLLWAQWMRDWTEFIRKQLKPERPVLFWDQKVSDEQKNKLTQFLRLQEKEWNYFVCLSASIYALRMLGYVRRACPIRDITRWMTGHLEGDYTTRNNRDQFIRAWKGNGRYTDDVIYYVRLLRDYGFRSLTRQTPDDDEDDGMQE